MWKMIILCIALLYIVEAADCINKCTSSQVCGDDGLCYKYSELTSCGYDLIQQHYCMKDQDCCGLDGCMPKGSNCCNWYYCPRGRTCCGLMKCCRAGYICKKDTCVIDNSPKKSKTYPTSSFSSERLSTAKPTTYSVRRHWFRRTSTFKPRTFFPRLTTYAINLDRFTFRSINRSSSRLKSGYAIVSCIVAFICAVIGVAIRTCVKCHGNRRENNGRVISVPAHTELHVQNPGNPYTN